MLCSENTKSQFAAITFQAQASPYPQSFFQPAVLAMNPSTWWKSIGKKCKLPEGSMDLMLTLHMTSASAACIERIFSTFGLVMTMLRNRLGMDKAKKLVFCYRMLLEIKVSINIIVLYKNPQ